MSRVKIFDTTLRDGEQSPGCSMNLHEKLEVARALEYLKVDVIEAGFAASSQSDFLSIQAVSGHVKDCIVCSLARLSEKDIDIALDSLQSAVSPRLHLFIATSPIHMKYKLKMTAPEMLELTSQKIKYAKQYISDIEFSAEDASRSDWPFLSKVYETAIRSGATVLNIPDTVGYSTPNEMFQLISYLKSSVVGIENVELSVHCHDDLGMATANSISAIRAGVRQVECTLNGIGERAGNAALEEIVMILKTRHDYYNLDCTIDTKRIYRASRLIQTITGVQIPPNKAIIGANAFAHEAGIHQHGVLANKKTYEIIAPADVGIPESAMVLGKHSGRHAFEDRLNELGYYLTLEELDTAFDNFKKLAERKKVVMDRDLEALIGSHTPESAGKYELLNFVINSGNNISSTAIIKLSDSANELEQVAIGDGPIDAAFKAVNMIVKSDFLLESYKLNGVTGGEDALGEAVVRIKLGDEAQTGRGVSTDIIEASIKAYINGVNKFFK